MDRQNAAVRQKQPPHSRATFMIRSCSLIRTSSTLVLFLVPLLKYITGPRKRIWFSHKSDA